MGDVRHAEAFSTYVENRKLAENLAVLLTVTPREISVPFCVAVLDHLGTGMPVAESAFRELREDAGFWAATAGPHELREYLGAACREIARNGTGANMALGARKRLLLDLWQSLPEADRRKFLARVDPKGVFRGAA